MPCSLLGQQKDSSMVEEEDEGMSCLPNLICPGRLGTYCVARGKVNEYPRPLSPLPRRHHHTTPDQVHETCSSHVECASCDWSLGKDKTQEATSLTTALVLAGNDKIFCPHQPHQSSGGRAREDRQTAVPNVPATHQVCVKAECSKDIATATVTASPIALLVKDTARGVLFARLSHTPTLLPPPLPQLL